MLAFCEAKSFRLGLKDSREFKQSMTSVKELLTERFKCIKIKDNYVKTRPAATEDDITEFFSVRQQRLDPKIQMDQLQNSAMSKCQDRVNFKENHCLTTTCTF